MAFLEVAFNKATGAILEGNHSALPYYIEPRPLFTPAVLGSVTDIQLHSKLPNTPYLDDWKIIFREDYFEPSGRIRRGRFYVTGQVTHRNWIIEISRGINVSFRTFESATLESFLEKQLSKLQVLLGLQESYTAWQVVMLERQHTGEILATLKSRSMLGILPDLLPQALPEQHKERILTLSGKLADEAHRALPELVIELCRNLASAVLTARNQEIDPTRVPKDLAEEAKFFFDHSSKEKLVHQWTIPHCANVIARLHAEAKAVEQAKSGTISPNDRDATLAVASVSRILVTLGWAI